MKCKMVSQKCTSLYPTGLRVYRRPNILKILATGKAQCVCMFVGLWFVYILSR